MSASSGPIPAFYRIFFTTIDPIMASFGCIANLFLPDMILDGYTPAIARPIALETRVLLDAIAGFFACIVVLQAILLRARPRDVFVWKVLQFGIVLVDIGMLWGLWRALSSQGRLDPGLWRASEAPNVVITGVVLVIRMAFVLGLGVGSDESGKVAGKRS